MTDSASVTFGHRSESIRELARTLALAVQGTASFPGGFYLGAEFWRAVQQAFYSESGRFQDEMGAVQHFLEGVLDPKNPVHHNFVDCLYCPNCRESFCEKHSPDTYQLPNLLQQR